MAQDNTVGRGGSWVRGGVLAPTAPAVTLLLLNLLDGLFTLTFLQLGVAREANPIMRWAYEQHPMVFMGLKLLVVSLGVFVLALHHQSRLAQIALKIATFVYAVIITWHLAFLTHLAFGR